MDYHVVAQARLRNKVRRNLTHNPAKLHAGDSHIALFLDFEDFSGYREAHAVHLGSQ
jgi:hypothetical protein